MVAEASRDILRAHLSATPPASTKQPWLSSSPDNGLVSKALGPDSVPGATGGKREHSLGPYKVSSAHLLNWVWAKAHDVVR